MTVQAFVIAGLLSVLLVVSCSRRQHHRHAVRQFEHDARLARRLGRLAGAADYAEHRQCPTVVEEVPAFDPELPKLRREQNADYCLQVVFDAARHEGWVAKAHEEIDRLIQPRKAVAS